MTLPPPLPPARMPGRGARVRAERTVALDTLREAVRGRWLWMSAAGALLAAGTALFARSLALTEDHALALAFAAPLSRLLAVLIVSLSAISSVTREQADRTLLLALAAPMRRSSWVAGKAAGLFVLALVTALVLSLPVLAFAPVPGALLARTFSLALELAVVAAVSLAVALVLNQVPPAVCTVLSFYLLARDLHVMQLLAQRAQNFSELGPAGPVVQALALLFPRLDLFARTDWLLGTPVDLPAMALLGAQAAIYSLLALSVAVLDLRRAQLS